MEEWRDVPGYEGRYRVSSLGRVQSLKGTPKILRPALRNGYPFVVLSVNREKRACNLHSLVLEAFVGPRPEGMEGMHLNGDRQDPRLDNLRYGTRRENQRMRADHGTAYRGRQHHFNKLTEDQVREIRAAKNGICKLPEKYGVSLSSIGFIRSGRNWAWLD